MTNSNENELKVEEVIEFFEVLDGFADMDLSAHINLIKQQAEDKSVMRKTIDAKSKALDAANAKCEELQEQLEAARQDSSRLDFILSDQYYLGVVEGRDYGLYIAPSHDLVGYGNSDREAIDCAIANAKDSIIEAPKPEDKQS